MPFSGVYGFAECTLGGQDRLSVKRPLRNDMDVGSNPAATRKKRKLEGPLHCRCPNGSAGSQWKTSDVKAELDLEKDLKKEKKKKRN